MHRKRRRPRSGVAKRRRKDGGDEGKGGENGVGEEGESYHGTGRVELRVRVSVEREGGRKRERERERERERKREREREWVIYGVGVTV